ncbi:site-2 protease family protein [Lignipirellula cremea]|nr:site-2 protease family protein [Lignipirellula cremea]
MCLSGFAFLILAATGFWGNPSSYWAMFQMVAGLGFVIFVHEMGHFLVAKACGVKCEKFYIGFDFFDIKIGNRVIIPRSLLKYQWGETEYGIGIIPLGGYVKMLGQDDDPRKYEEEMARSRKTDGTETKVVAGTETEKAAHPHHESVTDVDMEPTPLPGDGDESFELDPRSYQAKNVPQRMAIISAGVIMNVIFAVIFATIAYSLGVSHVPTEIGRLAPGGAAYAAGVPVGGRIVQLAKGSSKNEHLRFRHDLSQAVMMAGVKRDLEVLVKTRDGKEEWYAVRPQDTTMETAAGPQKVPTIGVGPADTTEISPVTTLAKQFAAAQVENGFQAGDVVTAVAAPEGEKVVIGDMASGGPYVLDGFLSQHANVPITFTIERTPQTEDGAPVKNAAAQTVTVTVPAQHMQRLGLVMKAGPIESVRRGSTGDKGGLKPGDELLQVDGAPLGDPLTLPDRLQGKYGQPVEVVVQRKDDKGATHEETLQVEVHPPEFINTMWSTGSPFVVQELGVTFPMLREVTAVMPDSPAAVAGLQAGDLVDWVSFKVEGDVDADMKNLIPVDRTIDLTGKAHNWMEVQSWLQFAVPQNKIQLAFSRGKEKQQTVTLKTYPAPEQFNPDRGLHFMTLQEIHKAPLGEAIGFGFRETKENLVRVATFLQRLATGEISPMNLGGPGMIAMAATSEAKQGTANFLLFLTFLSANLAIVNFLPIPVLDGGHMMFLTYEAIFRRPVSEKWFVALSLAGLAFVLSLMLFVVSLDIFRFAQMFS